MVDSAASQSDIGLADEVTLHPNMRFTADLTESLMSDYGDRLPLDEIAKVVHDVLAEHVQPGGARMTEALTREAVRRLRRLNRATGPGPAAQRSDRAEEIVQALRRGSGLSR